MAAQNEDVVSLSRLEADLDKQSTKIWGLGVKDLAQMQLALKTSATREAESEVDEEE